MYSPGCCHTLQGIQGWLLNLQCLLMCRHMLPPLERSRESEEIATTYLIHHFLVYLALYLIYLMVLYLFYYLRFIIFISLVHSSQSVLQFIFVLSYYQLVSLLDKQFKLHSPV